jgi:hypothetical protein
MPETKQPKVKAQGFQPRAAGGVASASATGKTQPAAATARKAAVQADQKKTPRKRATTTATGTRKTESKKPEAESATPAAKSKLSSDERHRLITNGAYLISLKRHAGASGADADWLFAETIIDMVFEPKD